MVILHGSTVWQSKKTKYREIREPLLAFGHHDAVDRQAMTTGGSRIARHCWSLRRELFLNGQVGTKESTISGETHYIIP